MTPEEELENLRNEVGVLRRAVESKSAAVGILRAELQECQREREKFRTLAEQGTLHRSSSSTVLKPAYSDPCRSAMLSGSDGTLAQLLSQSKEENKMLRQDATELRCKLHDAQADIKVLREEVQRSRGDEGRRRSHVHTTMSKLAHQEREQFISQMEELSAKCQALEGDVRGLVEEREELVRELDASSHKLHRLNYILNTVLSNISAATTATPPKRIIDLDAIITENRYLQQRLKQSEEEKALAKSNASKYKAALEKCRSHGSLKLGTSENLIVTPQQVGELLHDYRGEVGGAAESDLKSLCVALVDALNQRSRALRTQRSANKVLVGRISELERRLSTIGSPEDAKMENHGASTGISIPELQLASLGLMDGYNPPAGPIVKYSEEEIIQDPRLAKIFCVISSGHEPVERRKCSDGFNKEIDNLKEKLTGNGENCSRNCESILEVSKNRVQLDSTNNCSNDNIKVMTNCSVAARVQCSSKGENPSFPVDETTFTKHDRKAVFVIESVCDTGEVTMPLHTAISNDLRRSSVTPNVVNRDKTRNNESLAINGVPSKEINVQNVDDKKLSAYVNSEDVIEEIIPIDKLDSYIREVQLKRKTVGNKHSKESKVSSDASDTSSNKYGNESKVSTDVSDTSNNKLHKESIENNVSDSSRASSKNEDSKVTSKRPRVGNEEAKEAEPINKLEVKNTSENEDDDDSFDLNISDYDSDNDNLDVALQEWQNDFGKGKIKVKGSPSKDSKVKRVSGKEGFNMWRKDAPSETQLPPALKELLDRATGTLDNELDCT